MGAVSRFNFLRGRFRGNPNAVRPPWALEAEAFASACDRCGRCDRACPERIIGLDRAGYPSVDFAAGACTFCGACADACPTGALDRAEDRAPWAITAEIGAGCLSFNGVDCRTCGDHCEARAIRFRPLSRGRWLPTIEAADCTGCGACVGPCPVKAIAVRPDRHEHQDEREVAACG